MKLAEAGRRLGLSLSRMHDLVKDGSIRAFRYTPRGHYFVDVAELERFQRNARGPQRVYRHLRI